MKKITTLIVTATILFVYACNNSGNTSKTETPAAQTNNVAEVNEHEHSASEPIDLNNGAKWKVVPEMMEYIKSMEVEVNLFHETQHTNLNDFALLGKSLQKNLDLLTSKCTMEGKAHDELHKWLLPFIDAVGELNSSKNIEESKRMVEEIHASFKNFNVYFE